MSLDLNEDYDKAKGIINSVKSYNDVTNSYASLVSKKGEAFEEKKEKVVKQIDKAKTDVKRFLKKIKSQLEQLLDINKVLAGKGSNSIRYVKNTFIKVIKIIEPILRELLLEEAINAVGCDLEQTYDTTNDLYIKVSSIDPFGLLKLDPTTDPGILLYEKKEIDVQTPKFSMNRELYERIQSSQSYSGSYGGVFYKGASGQDLFDIQFVQTNNLGETGPFYKISLKDRFNANNVKQFLIDYYQSISIVDFSSIIANIMNALSGCLSISANLSIGQVSESTKFSLIIQRILGLCFDNVNEIDVSGVGKVSEIDGVDESFFEFTELDLREIEQIVENVLNSVTELEDCDNILIPVDATAINEALNTLRFVPDEDQVDGANNASDAFADSVDEFGIGITGDFKAKVDLNFILKIVEGIVFSLLSPKVLLPIFIMLESLGLFVSTSIKNIVDFSKSFGKLLTKLISRIGAIFTQKLFEIISKDIKQLLQQIIKDIAKEQADIRIIVILKLIQLIIVVAEFVKDFRRCKSVIDEILWLLKIATTGWGKIPGFAGKVPYPLLLFSKFLDGASATREFVGTIQEYQKLGIPTGALPDGSPNLDLLSKFGQLKASQKEKAENGTVEMSLSPLDVSPTRVVDGVKLYGKYF